ncbi:hypothetical protein GCM10009665_42840 [Kitasatospora nipponensis]|uniref:PAS domain-containing protein n=1 Tax=Kitasatospora nipponensis TaxID=258049 RepID=A0ABN1WDU2_9ACTN
MRATSEGGRRADSGGGTGSFAVATALIDADGRVQRWSEGARALTGYPAREVVGRHASLLADGAAPRGAALVRALLRAGDPPVDGSAADGGARRDRLRRRDGTCHTLAWHPVAVPLAGGEGVLAVALPPARPGAAADVTAGDVAALERLVGCAPLGLAALDTELRFVFVNEALARLNGRPVEQHLGRFVLEVLDLPHPSAYERVLRRVVDGGETVEGLRAAAIGPAGDPYAVSGTLFPLRAADGTVTGVGGYVRPLGDSGAELLDTARGRRRPELLGRVGTGLGRALDPRTVTAELLAACEPGFADALAVDLLAGAVSDPGLAPPLHPTLQPSAGPLVHPLVPPRDAGRPRPEDALAPPRPASAAAAECTGSARPVPFEEPRHGTTGRAAPHGVAVPLVAGGGVLGAVTFHRADPFGEEDLLLAGEIAARTATALGNALLYRRERLAALALQRRLLPARLPSTPWFRPAYRYRPAEDDTLAGGDWYDALVLPGARVGVGVGDVMGHGLGAAAAMGRYRASVHALLAVGLAPGQLLTRLDGLFAGGDDDLPATCACVVYDAGTGRCRLALAGHPPPLLIGPDGSVEVLSCDPGPPLGMGLLQVYPDVEHPVAPGSLLVLYSDGMIEDRGPAQDLDQGIALLGRAVRDPAAPLDEVCDALLAARPAGSADDATLLVARLGRV